MSYTSVFASEMSSSIKVFLHFAVFFSLYLTGVSAACLSTIDYVFGNETNYDRNYSSIQSGKKPLGFSTGLWLYNTKTNPCVKVQVASGHRIEVMVDTEPPNTRICVKDQIKSMCQPGKIYDCRPTDGNTMTFEFYCDSGCSEADVNFWYRFTLSKPPSELDPELWCDSRDSSQFPDSLIAIPIPPVKPKPQGPAGTASTVTPSLLSLTFFNVILLMCSF